jgi:uncharacterized protein (TIGR02246 family)
MAMACILRLSTLLFVSVALAAGQAISQATQHADEAAITLIVSHWQQAWDNFDASVLDGDYAEDADWMNAFGAKEKGATKIMSFMVEVVKRPSVVGRHTVWNEPRMRFIRPDVAIAYRDYQTVGQKTLDGKEMPQRNTHSTWVLSKENGKWRIVSQVISDDKPSS